MTPKAMAEIADNMLLQRHLDGIPGAFDVLTQRYLSEVFSFVLRFVNNASAAEDLVQETFLQIHLSAKSFDPKRAFRPWLYTIAANKARDYLRSHSRRRMQSLDTAQDDDDRMTLAGYIGGEELPADEQAINRERIEQVQAVIDRMPDHLRTILVLGHFQKLPYAEISEVLDIPVGTVKSRLHAAVKHFSTLWNEPSQSADCTG
jgi:RNA polymerase sigma-70 factor (ECF subfamily)